MADTDQARSEVVRVLGELTTAVDALLEAVNERESAPDFYTAEEVAGRLRVHINTVRAMCASGELDAIKAGRHWRIRSESAHRAQTKAAA